MTIFSNKVIYLVSIKMDIIIKTIKTINIGYTLHYNKHIILLKL